MRFIPTLIFALFASIASAQDRDIQAVISNQIDAFKADDLTTAFDYASPKIQRLFRSPEIFGQMVQRGYPMVWRPADLAFLDQSDVETSVIQRIEVRDQRGRRHLLDYLMISTAEGWRIDGVALVPPLDTGV
mgnify:CR=1 FL=1